MKELTNKQQLLKTNAQTVSNGQLLISGGAYYINMTSNGQQLKIKDGANLQVEFPKKTNKQMEMFYGTRDSLGNMNWQSTQQSFTKVKPAQTTKTTSKSGASDESDPFKSLVEFITSDTTKMTEAEKKKYEKENQLYTEVYSAINIKQFGWINCDYFPKEKNLTDVFVNINIDSIKSAEMFLVFEDINSVMSTYYSKNKKALHNSFQNIPIGYKVKLVAFTIKNEKLYAYSSNITVKKQHNENITLTPIPENEFAAILNGK